MLDCIGLGYVVLHWIGLCYVELVCVGLYCVVLCWVGLCWNELGCGVVCCVASCHVLLYVALCHVVLFHVTLCRGIVSCCVVSCVVLCCVVSCCVISCYVVSWHCVMLCCVVLSCVMLSHVMLYHPTLGWVVSCSVGAWKALLSIPQPFSCQVLACLHPPASISHSSTRGQSWLLAVSGHELIVLLLIPAAGMPLMLCSWLSSTLVKEAALHLLMAV